MNKVWQHYKSYCQQISLSWLLSICLKDLRQNKSTSFTYSLPISFFLSQSTDQSINQSISFFTLSPSFFYSQNSFLIKKNKNSEQWLKIKLWLTANIFYCWQKPSLFIIHSSLYLLKQEMEQSKHTLQQHQLSKDNFI